MSSSSSAPGAPYTLGGGFGAVADLMERESGVNGVWNSILVQHYFPFPKYIIQPEMYTSKGTKADLVVTRTSDGKIMLCYEGKKAGGASAAWDNARHQGAGYIAETKAKYAMIGLGRKVIFVTPVLADVWELNENGKPMKGNKPLDVVNDSVTIDKILTFIASQVGALYLAVSNHTCLLTRFCLW